MSGLNDAIAQIQALGRKFEGLLDAARNKTHRAPPTRAPGAKGLRELTAFGQNPGNLRMFVHIPERLPSKAPLVVALHGCSQTADEYDRGSGWSALADRFEFAVVYPEQQPVNNPKNCFSWFLPGDIARDQRRGAFDPADDRACDRDLRPRPTPGVRHRPLGRRRDGVGDAGNVPGGVRRRRHHCGHSLRAARSVQEAFEAMFTDQSPAPRALGDRVRAASRYCGPWPKISVWHGTADPIVKPSNSENIIRQWTDLHGLAAAPSYEEAIGNHSRRVWNDADGNALIEAFSISGMAHGVPLAAAMGAENCGAGRPILP